MAPPPGKIDVFCRVVDNFGDAGVAMRLSRQLALEHGAQVTLWIDDIARLARFVPEVETTRDDQRCDAVRVRALANAQRAGVAMPDLVVETFGCGLPEAYLDAMERVPHPPVWVNLEYLSAEPWVDAMHALPSPPPRRALRRWFLFPGFTPGTGGLLRERTLLAERDRHQADPLSRATAWTSVGLPAPPRETLTVSLFCYPSAALPALLEAWRDDAAPVACLVPDGILPAGLGRFFPSGTVPAAGDVRSVGALTIAVAPFVDQHAFDRRLWSCDLNIVRGEDSFVRAQWAARPLAWQPYPQAESAHLAKHAAFLDRYAHGLDATPRRSLHRFAGAFNEQDAVATFATWRTFRSALPALQAHAAVWAAALAQQSDLATQLVDFYRNRL